MRMHYIFAIALLGIALLGLSGCNGPTMALDPQITFTFPELPTDEEIAAGALLLPYIYEGNAIKITGEATVSDDANRIISSEWTQSPEVGEFISTDQMATIWHAPILAPGVDQLPVTLSMRVKTLQGGETVNTLNLIVVPSI